MVLSGIFKKITYSVLTVAVALLMAGWPGGAVQAAPHSTTPWITYLGGGETDMAKGIITDAAGNIYITGFSNSLWSDVAGPVVPKSNYPSKNAFIAKLNADGALVWHTFYGVGNTAQSVDIALDTAGDVYITGTYKIDTEYNHSFVAKFNGGSGVSEWSTDIFNSASTPTALTVAGDYVYVTGSGDPDYWEPQLTYGGVDCLMVRISTTNGANSGGATFGGSGSDRANDIAVDGSGNIYVTGYSDGSWDTTAFGTGINPYPGTQCGFLVKLIDSTFSVAWHTFIGSAGNYGTDIALDGGGNIYITGSSSEDWGGEGITVTPLHGLNSDAYVAKYNNVGQLVWNTFLGSEYYDHGDCISVKPDGSIFVAGQSNRTWGSPIRPLTVFDSSFVAGLDNDGNVVWNTFFRCPVPQEIQARGENLYLAGHEPYPWGEPIHPHNGSWDVLIIKMGADGSFDPPANLTSLTENLAADLNPGFDSGTYDYTLAAANAETTVTLTVTLEGATIKYSYGAVTNKTVASGAGEEVPLNLGGNEITVDVSKTGMADTTYTITVTRAEPDPPANLTLLTENLWADFNLAFTGGAYAYTLAAANAEASVTLNAVLEGAAILYSYGETTDEEVASGVDKNIPLGIGENTVTIKVSKGGFTDTTYTITITRPETDPPANLTSLAENLAAAFNPEFTGGAYTYTLAAAFAETSVTLTAALDAATITYSYGEIADKTVSSDTGENIALAEGDNVITINVAKPPCTATTYTITVTRAPASTVAEILTYSFPQQAGNAVINSDTGTVTIEVVFGTDVNSLIAAFTVSPLVTSVEIGGMDQVSGTTANDFTNPVTYTVTAEAGNTKDWVVTVTVAPANTIATITSGTYNISAGGTETETITNVPHITAKAAFLANLTKGQADQTWNTDNIADPVATGNTLVVTAQDGTTIVTYTVTVNAAPNNNGGGGGGGGGFAPQPVVTPEPELEPEPPAGTTSITGSINNEGVFTEVVSIVAEDQSATLNISEGTVGLDADLEPLAEITMVPLSEPPAPVPGGTVAFMYDLGPDGATFEPAITLSIPLPEGADPAAVSIAYWDGNEWITLETAYDPVTGRLTALTSHFTVFAAIVLEKEPEPAVVESNPESVTTTPVIAETPVTPAPAETLPEIKPAETMPVISENPVAHGESKRSFAWYWWVIISIGAIVIFITGWIEWRRVVINRKTSGKST